MDLNDALHATNLTSKTDVNPPLDPRLYNILFTFITVFGLCIALVATAGNILTIIVYFRLGFAESTNVSLVTLAISDMIVAFTTGCNEAFYVFPFFTNFLVLPGIDFATSGWAHLVFSRFSALITSFLSIERYLCVLVPLKIKRIFTPRRTFMVMIFTFTISVPPVVVVYFRYPLGMRYVPGRNKTLFGIQPYSGVTVETLYKIWQAYIANVLTFTTITVVTSCTVLLSLSLQKSRVWRDANRHVTSTAAMSDSGANNEKQPPRENKMDTKEARAVRMVVAIATVFIIFTIPYIVHVSASMTVLGFEINGQYSDAFVITGHAFLVLDAINAGANVLIYYNMSTKFRTAVRAMVCSVKKSS